MLRPCLSSFAFILTLCIGGLWASGLVVSLGVAKAQQPERTVETRRVQFTVRVMEVPHGTQLARETAEGGPSGAIEDIPSDWELPADSVGPSPYGCIYSWPAPEGDSTHVYHYYAIHNFYSQGILDASSGKREGFKLKVHSPAAPKQELMSVVSCMAPDTQLGIEVTEVTLKHRFKGRNDTGTVLTFTTEYENPARQ